MHVKKQTPDRDRSLRSKQTGAPSGLYDPLIVVNLLREETIMTPQTHIYGVERASTHLLGTSYTNCDRGS